MPARSKSVLSSFVRASAAEDHATAAAGSTMRVALSPWPRPLEGYDSLPRSLYPILPSPVAHIQVQFMTLSRSSSNTGADNDTVMTDAYHNEGESEDVDGIPLKATHSTFQRGTTTNYLERREDSVSEFQEDEGDKLGLCYEPEEETIIVVKPTWTLWTKEKKKAMKAVDEINRHSKRESVKNAKSEKGQKKGSATGNQNALARRTRSSTRPQPASEQSGDEIAEPTEKKAHDDVFPSPPSILRAFALPKTRKTWLPWETALPRDALVAWWTVEGTARYNHLTKMFLPKQKDVQAWDRISAECKALNGSFNRPRGGAYIIARSMKDDDDLPPVSVPADSTAGLRRRK